MILVWTTSIFQILLFLNAYWKIPEILPHNQHTEKMQRFCGLLVLL